MQEIHSEAELKERKKKYDSVLEMEGEKGSLLMSLFVSFPLSH